MWKDVGSILVGLVRKIIGIIGNDVSSLAVDIFHVPIKNIGVSPGGFRWSSESHIIPEWLEAAHWRSL